MCSCGDVLFINGWVMGRGQEYIKYAVIFFIVVTYAGKFLVRINCYEWGEIILLLHCWLA